MASATSQVFSTTELLETILFALPTRDILLAQGVSKQWHLVIEASEKLQRALFFEPAKGDGYAYAYKDDVYHEVYFAPAKGGPTHGQSKIFTNRLLANELDLALLSANMLGSTMDEVVLTTWRSPDASWRRMSLTQPPVKAKFEVLLGYDQDKIMFREFDINTMHLGAIVNKIEEALHDPNASQVNCVTIPGSDEREDLKSNEELGIAGLV